MKVTQLSVKNRYSKFSRESFDTASNNAEETKMLLLKLHKKIEAEILSAASNSLNNIIEELNKNGHSLQSIPEDVDWGISFRDVQTEGKNDMDLGCYIVITTSFGAFNILEDD